MWVGNEILEMNTYQRVEKLRPAALGRTESLSTDSRQLQELSISTD